ncbi:MAG: hypothetical protein GKR90_01760 [Pseudomonadales bacterium]|nr:hypothetical protein [Pseudomonadales bacterium]
MGTLTTDLIGRVFSDAGHRFLVTDRTPKRTGCAVVRRITAKQTLLDMPVNEIVQKVYAPQ